MRFLFIVLVVFSSAPCFAKKDRVVLDVRGDLHISGLFDQEEVYAEFPDVLVNEGLGGLVPINLPPREAPHFKHFQRSTNTENITVIPFTDEVIYLDPWPKKRDPEPFFVKDNIVQQPKTSKDLNEALKEEFMRRKLYAMKKELALGCSPVVCDLGFNTLSAWTGCLGPLGGGMALVKVMTGVRDLSRELLKAVGAIRDDLGTDPLAKYELKYAKRKRFLPESLQETIENLFQMAYDTEKGRVEALDKLPKLLRLPTHSKEPRRDFIQPVESLTKGFQTDAGQDFTESLLELLVGHYARYEPKAVGNTSPKYIVCLEGAPGIGKTHLVQGIADNMELDFISISLSEGIGAVFGDSKSPGSLLEALTKKKNSRNLVIFFDEADGALNNAKEVEFWKKFFDPNSPGFYSRWANADIDLSHALFVIACNSPIKDPALQDRMRKFNLRAPTVKQKEYVLRESIVPTLGQACDPTMRVKEEELEADFVRTVAEKTDGQGFRPSQKLVQDQMNKLRLQRLRDEKSSQPLYQGKRRNGLHHFGEDVHVS